MIQNNLSRILGERKWTQAELARRTGIRPNTISDLILYQTCIMMLQLLSHFTI